ncbi:MAG: cytochrome c3 family protein [Nitrospirae bacterium]|nr:cytochrome c3 family protein [Nitrospirota bacterium]
MRIMLVVGMIALGGWMLSSGAWAAAGITGSAHDFSGESWTGEICNVCHTPHNAGSELVPLWNHATTATDPFTLYTSSTLDATPGQPEGVSKACLSCHDGTVAIDSFGGATGSTTLASNDDHNLGTDLSNDHPISFTYDAALATTDGGLYNPTTETSGLGSTIEADMLVSGKVECSSCHDVHNSSGLDDLLVKSNATSALCLTCHDK